VSEDGSGGQCADGNGVAGTTALASARSARPSLLAVSPSASTLAVLDIDAGGALRQSACFAAAPRAGCTVVPALSGASDVAVQAGFVYVAARDADAIAVFRSTDGGLVPAGCASPTFPGCTPARALDGPVALAVEAGPYAHGGNLFVASRGSDALAVFRPDGDSGALTQVGCVQQTGGGDACTAGRALNDPAGVAANGEGVVVASSGSNGVATFTRDGLPVACTTQGGAEGCGTADGLAGAAGVALFGTDVYVSAPGSGSVTWLRRDAPGGLTPLGRVGVAGGAGLALPPETGIADAPSFGGSHLYVASRAGSIGVFGRDRLTGALAPLAPAPGLRPGGAVEDVVLSADDPWSPVVYAAGAGGILVLARNIPPSCGGGFAPPPPIPRTTAGRAVRIPLRCYDPNREPIAYSVASGPAHGRVTGFEPRADPYGSDAAVYLPDPGYVGSDSFEVRASDGAESATVRLAVEVEPAGAGRGPRVLILDRRLRMDRRGRVRVRLRCPATLALPGGVPANCRTTLELRRGGRRAGRAGATVRRGHVRRVRVRLARRVQRRVRKARRGITVAVRVSARGHAAVPVSGGAADGPLGRTSKRLRVSSTIG